MTQELRVGNARAYRIAPRRHPHTSNTPLRVAISGGIGAGKSTLAAALRPYALAFADADAIAREIVTPGSDGLKEIRQRFGDSILNPDNTLNRSALANLIFSDEKARHDLETITHPKIAARAHELLNINADGFTIYDVPLLLNEADIAQFHEVIIVTAPYEQRLMRLEKRGLTREDAQKRINAQITDEQRNALATIVVENNASPDDAAALGRRIAEEWL